MFSGRKVKWNHFGKKYTLLFSDFEMQYSDLYDVLMKKVYEIQPDFKGAIAFIDRLGRQVTVNSDRCFRDAFTLSQGTLKLHTTLIDGQVLSAAELVGRQYRSQSVPPSADRGYHSYPSSNTRSPSSMDSASHASCRNRTVSPTLPKPAHSEFSLRSPGSCSGVSPLGYGLKYPSYAPYSQNLLYGMPPHNGMLLRFLTNPFPFGGYHRYFVGPNKYHHFGGWRGHKYYVSPWGPMW
ncbi:hypothetical protein DICVIV_03534 [Dictyocaulus viviparus]|uniref:Uncharacterized protein n=1 Tax=Dictyocaulus viviparus TaxID=29172 RepID=A0A0D8Y0X1_DICVI|nr:hypothetical protein DICVIV_03534 [Dictyocaulus viviparus]